MKSELVSALALAVLLLSSSALAEESPIRWQDWPGAGEQARAQKRFLLLNMEAVWCHWCHVMEKTTYRDPRVIKLIQDHTVPVKVDQDAQPELGLRYQEYGWPATIIFDSNGQELARLTGYQTPQELIEVFEKLLAAPKPLPDDQPALKGDSSALSELWPVLEKRHYHLYDSELGGWGDTHKFVNGPVVEYCLERALAGSQRDATMAKTTLTNNLALLDPEWGGVYQYSDSARWDRPHFEKLMATQAANLRVYSLAYAQFQDPKYRQAADQIARYMTGFLRSPEGAFYSSQDADLIQGQKASDYFALPDAERRKLGIPRIDPNLYPRDTGLAVEALALYSGIIDRPQALQMAVQGADWVLGHRRLPNGAFRHSDRSETLLLGDTLACGRGFLALYQVTGNRRWLSAAQEAADALAKHFQKAGIDGLVSANNSDLRVAQENVAAARFANLLSAYTGDKAHRDLAQAALQFFAVQGASDGFNPGGLLLVREEMAREPVHMTVVGDPKDPQQVALVKAVQSAPTGYLRLDYWAPGALLPPNTEIEYPNQPNPAVYVCRDGRCSLPLTTPEEVVDFWKQEMK